MQSTSRDGSARSPAASPPQTSTSRPAGRSSSSSYSICGSFMALHFALCFFFSQSQHLLALTGLVEVDDEEADEGDAAGAVVLAAARQEVRAAEVALPALFGSSPSQLRSKYLRCCGLSYCFRMIKKSTRVLNTIVYISLVCKIQFVMAEVLSPSLAPRRLLTRGRGGTAPSLPPLAVPMWGSRFVTSTRTWGRRC